MDSEGDINITGVIVCLCRDSVWINVAKTLLIILSLLRKFKDLIVVWNKIGIPYLWNDGFEKVDILVIIIQFIIFIFACSSKHVAKRLRDIKLA